MLETHHDENSSDVKKKIIGQSVEGAGEEDVAGPEGVKSRITLGFQLGCLQGC